MLRSFVWPAGSLTAYTGVMAAPRTVLSDPAGAPGDRPAVTAAVTRGAARLLLALGCPPLAEVTIANGRRADLMGVMADGAIVIVEVKSGLADLRADTKWDDYLAFADRFYFAVPPGLTLAQVLDLAKPPDRVGLIVADAYDGAVVREAQAVPMAAARRKALLIRLARLGANRLGQTGDLAAP
ncbi:MmcB family DNA repair protein [Rhodothalassium salexigens]|uniref:MmcB family DNA repair protein n=1 Tax=Rhodothalassium salexigens TaxID=1086 RepID=UPI0023EEB03F|nr:MmcB family DNA repair protein [Rhodothalassium salexigens]